MTKVMIVAGGTGGHIFPALAVAELMTDANYDVQWMASQRGLEQKLVTKYPLHSLPVQALRGKSMLARLMALYKLFVSICRAWRILRKMQPELLLTMGGYASAPGVVAAWLLRIPIVMHEQNSCAGLTNRVLARFASKVLSGFPKVQGLKDYSVVGNPVRQDFINLPQKQFADVKPLKILVVGGSQGAQFFNQTFPGAFSALAQKRQIAVRHQTGVKQFAQVQAAYANLTFPADVSEFIDDMAEAYAWADIILARSGASTVAEVAAAGLPAVFVPYPYAVDDHQFYNAKWLADADAAIIVRQGLDAADKITDYMTGLAHQQLLDMSVKARAIAYTNAGQEIFAYCAQALKLR